MQWYSHPWARRWHRGMSHSATARTRVGNAPLTPIQPSHGTGGLRCARLTGDPQRWALAAGARWKCSGGCRARQSFSPLEGSAFSRSGVSGQKSTWRGSEHPVPTPAPRWTCRECGWNIPTSLPTAAEGEWE